MRLFFIPYSMTTRPATRGLSNRPQNENLTRPPLPGRANTTAGVGLDPVKMLTLKRKAEGVPEGSKAPKKRSALGEITNVRNDGGVCFMCMCIIIVFSGFECT